MPGQCPDGVARKQGMNQGIADYSEKMTVPFAIGGLGVLPTNLGLDDCVRELPLPFKDVALPGQSGEFGHEGPSDFG